MRDYYAPVRSLILEGGIFRSFISEEHNLHLKLRNPLQSDLSWIFEYSPARTSGREIGLLARCIYSINGRRFEGDEALYFLCEFLPTLSRSLHKRLLITLTVLLDESDQAFRYLEPYSYETESRAIWLSWKAQSEFGIPFLKEMNEVQLHWTTWNQIEDERKRVRQEWEQALLVTSSMNAKGAKSIREGWESDDKKTERYREDLMARARRGDIEGVEKRKARHKDDDYDDLKAEYKRWLKGEEDDHDRIIREYKQSMYRKIEEEKERAEQARRDNRKRRQEAELLRNTSSISAPVVGLTDEEVARLASTPKRFKETSEYEEKFEHIKERYILAKEASPNVSVDEEGNLVSVVPQKKSLMEQLANRTPTLED